MNSLNLGEDFEREKPILSSVAAGATGVLEDFFSLVGEMAGVEDKSSSENGNSKLNIGGQTEIEFNQRQSEAEKKLAEKMAVDKRKAFYQALKEEYDRVQRAKDKLWFEEEINDIAANLSTEEKNILLHYQANYRDRSIYQKAELRKKLIEQARKAEKKQKAAAIPSPAKKASALEAAFEGGSGTQGSGTANLSAQATG